MSAGVFAERPADSKRCSLARLHEKLLSNEQVRFLDLLVAAEIFLLTFFMAEKK
jgi:hypothetical protein